MSAATVYLDGAQVPPDKIGAPLRGRRTEPLQRDFMLDHFPPDEIEAIEVYVGAAQTPAQYSATARPGGHPVAPCSSGRVDLRVSADARSQVFSCSARGLYSAALSLQRSSGMPGPLSRERARRPIQYRDVHGRTWRVSEVAQLRVVSPAIDGPNRCLVIRFERDGEECFARWLGDSAGWRGQQTLHRLFAAADHVADVSSKR